MVRDCIRKDCTMEKEIRRLQYLFLVVFILCVIWLTAHYTDLLDLAFVRKSVNENVLGIPPTDVIGSRMNG